MNEACCKNDMQWQGLVQKDHFMCIPRLLSSFIYILKLFSIMVNATSLYTVYMFDFLFGFLFGDLVLIFNAKALSIRSLTFCLTLITKRIMRGLFSGKRTVTL